jgi:hypothetical protein
MGKCFRASIVGPLLGLVGLLAAGWAPAAQASVSPTQAKTAALSALKATSHGPVIVFKLASPLRAGTVIRQAGAAAPPSSSSARSLPAVQRARRRSYFFYEDRGPYQAYQHAGRVALVDARSGAVSLSAVLSWAPVIGSSLPAFLRSRTAYDLDSNRVYTSPYVAAAASRARATAPTGDAFGTSMRPAFRSVQSQGNARAVLAAERSCAIGAGEDAFRTTSRPDVSTLLPVLRYSPTSGHTLASFVATEAIAKDNCADILISLAGSGYAHASQPTVRLAVRMNGGKLRSYDVRASDLRSLITAHPDRTFKLLVDAPYSGGFIEALKAQTNLLVIATATGATQRAFRFLASKRSGAGTLRNPQPRIVDSSFTNTQLLGTTMFVDSDAEVSNAIGARVAKRSPSFLAWMIARGFALGAPLDFTADLGQTPRLFTQGFVATPPSSGGGGGGGQPPVNHAPTASDQSVSAVEDTAKAITLSGSDPDGTAVSYAIASNPAHGTLSGAPPNVTYTPASDYSGPDSFTFTVSDGSLTSAPATVSITVGAVDDPPVVSGTGAAVSYTEDDLATAVGGAVSVADVDSASLTGATAQITAGLASGEDVLALPAQPGISSSYDASTGTLTLSGSASVAAYEAALQAVTYRDASENPSTSQRTVTFKARDAGGFGATSSTRAVNVVAVNDAPVLTTSAGPVSFTEADPATPIDPGLTLADPDSQIAGATVAVTANFASGEDVLGFTSQNGITGSLNGAGDTLTLSGTATVANYQAALRSVTFRDTSANPDTSTRTVSFQATDTSAAASNTATRDVNVTASDTPPTVVNSAGSLTYTENDPATAIDPAVAVSDPDSANLTGATVQITGNHAAGEDVLSYVQPGGVSVTANAYDSATGTLTLTGSDTVAHYQQALAAVAYANSSDNPSTAARTVTFTARDLGGFGTPDTHGITITAVDDPPTAVNDSPTVSEDSGATPIAVLANDTDPDGGAKTITAKTDGSHGTVAITGGGTGLTYTPDANYCNDPPAAALDTFTYTLNGSANAAQTATVSVDVTCVDDPSTAAADSATVSEDSGANSIDVRANDSDIDSGVEQVQSVTQPTNGTAAVTNGGSDVSYTPNANYCNNPPGTSLDTFTYKLTGGNSATVTVTVTCVDDPSTAAADSATVTEDSGANTIDVRANDSDIDSGVEQVLSVTQPANGTAAVTNAGSDVSYTPNANYCNNPPGTSLDTFTYKLTGGNSATVTVTVTCVPDAPVVTTSAGSLTYTENAPATAVDPAITVTDPDTPPDQVTGALVSITSGFDTLQDTLSFTPVGNVTGIYSSAFGTLSLTGTDTIADYQLALRSVAYANSSDNPAPLSRTISYKVTDTTPADSNTATKTITITAVDDPPVAVDDSATVTEDDPATAIAVLSNDTDVDGGAKTITGITQPFNGTVAITGGGSGLTYKPAANYCNNPPGTTPDTFTYTLNSSAQPAQTATVSITVTCVNDAPTATDQTFTGAEGAVGNTDLYLGTTRPAGQAGKQAVTAHNLLTGSNDIDGPGPLQTVAATGEATANGGTVDINTDGTFVFHPKAGTSCTTATDSFSFTVTDQNATGPGPTPGTVTKTATVGQSGCVWYVKNNASSAIGANTGTSATPFTTLAQAETASSAGDTIYVFAGDGSTLGMTSGFTLKANQRLLGEKVPLTIGTDTLFAGTANRPVITDTTSNVVDLAAGSTVSGLKLDPQGGHGISGSTGATIADVQVTDTTPLTSGNGVNLTGGTYAISDLAVSEGSGVALNTSASSLAFTGTDTFADTAGPGVVMTGGTQSGTIDTVTAAGSSTGGVNLSSTSGSLTFTNLSLTTTSGATAAFRLSPAAGITVSGAGTDNVSATGGPAIDVSGSTPTLAFDSVSSTNSSTTGLNLNGLGTGTFSATGGTLAGFTGTAVAITGGSGAITYAGAINDGAGNTASVASRTGGAVTLSGNIADGADAGGGVALSGNSGGSTVLSGTSKVFNTGAGSAVAMTNSAGHTLSIPNGGLSITATSGNGLTADSGSIDVSGPGTGNSIVTTTGGALLLDGAAIDSGNVTFQSISANGAAVGIRLNTTGANGRLIVTGNGGTCTNADTSGCSGGEIQNTTGADNSTATPTGTGIVLDSTTNPSFTRMYLHGNSNYAIRGTTVAGLTLANSVISGTNGTNDAGPFEEGSASFDNLTGSASVSNSAISGGYADNFRVQNTSGSLDRITFQTDTIGDNSASNGNDAVELGSSSTAGALKATIDSSTFTGSRGDLVDYDHGGSGLGDLVLTANHFSNNHPGIATGGGGLTLSNAGTSGATTMNISNNTFRDAVGPGILIVKTTGTSTQTGTFSGNTIGVSGVANSGSAEGSALKLQSVGQGTMTWSVTSNTIHGYNNNGIEVEAGGGATAQSGAVNTTITGNTIDQPGTTAGTQGIAKNGIHLNIGTVPGDTYQACALIGGAGALANSLASSGEDAVPPVGGGQDVRLRQRQSTTIRLPGYAGAATDTTAVQNFVAANNPSGGPSVIAAASSNGFTGTGTSCP